MALLAEGWRDAGTHEVPLAGVRAGSGVYFARLEAGGEMASRKVILR